MAASRNRTRAAVLEREARICLWISQGMHVTEVARRENVTQQRISQIWKRGLERAPVANINEYRANQLVAINALKRKLAEKLDDPKTGTRDCAELVNASTRLLEREAKLLGLDAAARSEIKVLTDETVADAIHTLRAENALQILELQKHGVEMPPHLRAIG